MGAGKRIAVFPEPGAIGPVMNLVGICQGLRDLGHECIFVLDPGLEGTASDYGFAEQYISCMEPMTPEESAKYWDDFMLRYLPSFRTSPYEQIATYVKGCWEAIVDTSRWSVKNGLGDLLRSVGPDLIINDNVALYPDTERVGCPWVRMISCSENEITDPDIPPHLSGCAENDKEGFERYRARFREVMEPIHGDFMDFIESCDHERLPFPEFVLPSPYLNLLLYPEPLRFQRRHPLDPEKFVYLDGCVRREVQSYRVPTFEANDDAPLIYLSFGSLGVADVDLLKRMIGVLGDAPYRVLVNVGSYLDQYDTPPPNVQLASWFPKIGNSRGISDNIRYDDSVKLEPMRESDPALGELGQSRGRLHVSIRLRNSGGVGLVRPGLARVGADRSPPYIPEPAASLLLGVGMLVGGRAFWTRAT